MVTDRSKTALGRVLKEAILPSISGDRCVHAFAEVASCRACVDACPQQAWLLDDEELGLDVDACDGCGLCVAACPERAIEHDHAAMSAKQGERGIALLACERSGAEGSGVIPCLNALGAYELLNLYAAGQRFLFMCSADCSQCDRGGVTESLESRARQLGAMLEDHGLEPFRIAHYALKDWKVRRALLSSDENDGLEPALSRRNWLKRALAQGVEQGAKSTGLISEQSLSMVPPAQLLGNLKPDRRFPNVPVIDPLVCDACGACVQLCPHQALVNLEGVGYQIKAQACTGCGLCEDVCAPEAIEVRHWQRPVVIELPLRDERCQKCGVGYQIPAEQDDDGALCSICRNSHNHPMLYQVLD